MTRHARWSKVLQDGVRWSKVFFIVEIRHTIAEACLHACNRCNAGDITGATQVTVDKRLVTLGVMSHMRPHMSEMCGESDRA